MSRHDIAGICLHSSQGASDIVAGRVKAEYAVMKCGARMVELEEQDKLSDQVIEEATAELQSLQEEQEEMAAEAEEQRAQDQGNATKACVTEPLLRLWC